MVLIHAGIHFNAILPWLATVAMGVNVISGMVGKLLLEPLAPACAGAARALPVARPVEGRGGAGRVLGCGDARCHDPVAQGAYPDLHRVSRCWRWATSSASSCSGAGYEPDSSRSFWPLNLIVLAVLAFVYPHLMVGPGKLIPGHKQLEADCFACHAPFTGAASPNAA